MYRTLKRVKCVSLLSIAMLISTGSFAKDILPGSAVKASRHNASHSGELYLQAGAFKSERNAQGYQRRLSTQFNYPVSIQKRGVYHIVRIGPIQTAGELRSISGILRGSVVMKTLKTMPVKIQKTTPVPMKNYRVTPIHGSVGTMDKDAVLWDKSGLDHFDITGALGVATVGVSDTQLLAQNNAAWNNFTGQLGVGYIYHIPESWESSNIQWFSSIEPELNVYYMGGSSIGGNVLQSGSNLTWSMPINSTRVMADAALTIASFNQFSLYGKGGLGNAWNSIGYSNTVNGGSTRFNLNTVQNSSFAWEAGAGVQYRINHRIGLSLEYLYTGLGTPQVSSSGNEMSTSLVAPGSFRMNTQAVLLGLHVAVL